MSRETATRAVEEEGFSEVKIESYGVCLKGELSAGFVAKKHGKYYTGSVCQSMFGTYLRFVRPL